MAKKDSQVENQLASKPLSISPMAGPRFMPRHEEEILEAARKHAGEIIEKAASKLKMSKNPDEGRFAKQEP